MSFFLFRGSSSGGMVVGFGVGVFLSLVVSECYFCGEGELSSYEDVVCFFDVLFRFTFLSSSVQFSF